MAKEPGTANKQFEAQMRAHRKAWTGGTAEYVRRKDYPGDAARAWVCTTTGCLNHEWPSHETYWLCPECWKIAPDVVCEFYTHAPYKVLPPKKKRQAASASAFAAWAKNRPRKPRPAESDSSDDSDSSPEPPEPDTPDAPDTPGPGQLLHGQRWPHPL
jgi:hypothetical protein